MQDGLLLRDSDPLVLGDGLPPGVAIAIDPVALVTTECITVTSAMRKHARWAHSSVSAILGGSALQRSASSAGAIKAQNAATAKRQASFNQLAANINDDDSLASRWGLRGKRGKSMQDNPLMSAFARLRSDLRGCKGRCKASRMEDGG